MKSTKLAGRYAKALFDYAQQQDKIEQVNSDLILVKNVIKENRELKFIIESPIIFPDKKNNIFSNIFDGKICDLTFGFLSLIIIKKREPALTAICDEFLALYNDYHNIKIVQVITASPLSPTLIEEIKRRMEKKISATVLIQEKIDPNIIGGVVIKYDDFLFDASITSKINQLRSEFSQNVYQAAF